VSDPLGITASPHAVIPADDPGFTEQLRSIIATVEPGLIVVGLPVALSGREGTSAKAARRMGQRVSDISGLPVEFYDERFSSVVAERALLESGMRRADRKTKRDMVAAAVMLQAFLDQRSVDPRWRTEGE